MVSLGLDNLVKVSFSLFDLLDDILFIYHLVVVDIIVFSEFLRRSIVIINFDFFVIFVFFLEMIGAFYLFKERICL